jgi:hypothetical protein
MPMNNRLPLLNAVSYSAEQENNILANFFPIGCIKFLSQTGLLYRSAYFTPVLDAKQSAAVCSKSHSM